MSVRRRPSLSALLCAVAAACTAPVEFGADDAAPAPADWSPSDGDGDGWPSGEDCDDANPAVHPGATEYCTGVDDDCDGWVDADDPSLSEDGALTCWADADGDGWGDGSPTFACGDCPAGTAAVYGDCDDDASGVRPDAKEVCNGVDDDCDGGTDEGLPVQPLPWYRDGDGDGFGAASSGQYQDCDPDAVPPSPDYVQDDTDCDDGSAEVHPGAEEWCDAVDQDCDGEARDGDSVDAPLWYPDADGDGYGYAGGAVRGCSRPLGYVSAAGDCDDGAPDVCPGAEEVCGDGIDGDCDGATDDGC